MSQDIHSIIERLKNLLIKQRLPLRLDEYNCVADARDESLAVASAIYCDAHDPLDPDVAALFVEAVNALPSLLEYILQLEEALKPFADHPANGPDYAHYSGKGGYMVELQHLRHAKTTLKEGK